MKNIKRLAIIWNFYCVFFKFPLLLRAPFLRLIKTREESFAPVQWMSILDAFIHREIASQQISKESSPRWWKRGELEGEEICLMVN